MKWMTKISMIAAVTFTAIIVFTAGMPGVAISAQDISKPKLAEIKSISFPDDGNNTDLIIKLSSPVTYTSYKTSGPLRLVIDLSQTTEGSIDAPVFVNKGNIRTVKVNRFETDAGVLTRMVVELSKDVEPFIVVSPSDPSELRVSFPALPENTPVVEKLYNVKTVDSEKTLLPPITSLDVKSMAIDSSQRALTSISASSSSIILSFDGAVGEFKAFRLNKPERYVVDLMNVKSVLATRVLPLNVAGVASARIGFYPDKTRVVFDAVNGSFPEASAEKKDSTIIVTLDVKPVSEISDNKVTSKAPIESKTKSTVIVKEVPAVQKTIKDTVVSEPVKTPIVSVAKAASSSGPSKVEMIDFQVVDGVSRVSVKLAGIVTVEPPVKTAGFVTLTVKNTLLPANLQRSLETQSFVSPILRITPMMVKAKNGNNTKIRIAMKQSAPFEFRQEGDMLFVDFKNPEGLTADKLAAETTDRKLQASSSKAAAVPDTDITNDLTQPQTGDSAVKSSGTIRNYKGRKVTLEFADAEVRKIFQLLAEVSNKNFVLGDDVTGAISLKLVNVPWDQALDIILDTKGLDKREDGNIILIKGKGKFKTQAEEELEIKKTAAKSIELVTETFSVNYSSISDIAAQFEKMKTPDRGRISPDTRTNKVIVKDTPQAIDDMRKLLAQLDIPEKQVMIEARIVEATSTFVRNLGVNWGMHYRDGSGSFMGINQMDTSFGGLATAAPTSGASGSPGGSMGISFGTLASNISIDLRLNAAASAGMVKIISSPKVATLNNKTARISQGQQIPYQNTTASTGAVTAFVAATLSLEVTPHINANGTIGMKIDAKNDAPGTGSPPPINTKQATTELLLKDGETTVIGGIFVDSEQAGDDGVPYLMDIPLLGNLFKSNAKTKTKTELLIFITPRILN